MSKHHKKHKHKELSLLRVNLACGQTKEVGWTGVDFVKTPVTDIVHDLFKFPWPFKDESVDEVFCSHFFEHIPGMIRGKWMDELYRIMKPEAKATFFMPYFQSARSMQDFTHAWPPVGAQSFLYFNKEWRNQNKLTHGHYDLKCDFDFTYGYLMQNDFAAKHEEARNFGVRHYWDVVNDIQVVLEKRKVK